MNSMTRQRREGEANSPKRSKTGQSKLNKPSWPEFVRLAHQAVVAIAGAGMINRAEPRACGLSRGSRRRDMKGPKRVNRSLVVKRGRGRATEAKAGFQPYWGKPTVRNEWRGWRKRRQDLKAVCHDARKGRNNGRHW